MFRKYWAAALAAALLWVASTAEAAPLEAYGKLPSLSHVTLTPDGQIMAYVRDIGTKRVVVAQDIATHKALGMVDVSSQKLRYLQWADNQTIVITLSMTTKPRGLMGHKQECYLAQTYNVVTKEQHALLDHVGGLSGIDDGEVMNVVLGVPQPRIVDGRTILFVRGVYFHTSTGHPALFRIDMSNNTTRLVSKPRDTRGEDWVVDGKGEIVAQSSYFDEEQHWKLDIFQNGNKTQVMDVAAPIETPSIEGLNEDGTTLVISTPNADGSVDYQQVSLKDGSLAPWDHAKVEFGGVITDFSSGRVVGGTRITSDNNYVFFDPHADKMWRSVKAAFKGATDVNLETWSDDRTMVIAHVFGGVYGEGYYFVNMKEHKAGPIGLAYTGIEDVAPQRWIDYKAGDGRTINAYLTLPPGKDPKNLPLIVLPHGGPHARDYPGFDWFSQALASRGYVVLQPQFRGSAGFGPELLHAGFGEFGKKMQSDLSDGVRALAAQGMIDPKRVCIVGASYGGYAALAGATMDGGLYRCAVSIAGLSDLRQQLRYWLGPGGDSDRGDRFWDRFLGIADYDDPKLNDISPIKHVDKVTIPVLLIHGKDDTVVPFVQSDDMADALKDAKKPYEFVVLKGEDHWLSKSETRLQMLQATVKFLETHNPPDPPSPGPVAAAK